MSSPPRYTDVPTNVRRILAGLPDSFHVCLEFSVGKDFDALVLNRKGMYVIEVKAIDPKKRVTSESNRSWVVHGEEISTNIGNPFGQATAAANTLKDYLRNRSAIVLEGRPAADQGGFWADCRIYPYVCLSVWNQRNSIAVADSWCWLTQCDPNISDPLYLFTALQKRDWSRIPQTATLQLSDSEIHNIIRELGLDAVDEETAIPGSAKWRPNIDDRALLGFQMGLRAEDLENVRKELARSPLLAIIGEPQIGKTSLVQLVATEFADKGQSVLYHDFRLDTPSVMLERFLAKTRTPIQVGTDDNISAFLLTLIDQHLIVILDNFESVMDAEDLSIKDRVLTRLLERLLSSASQLNSCVLFTSRYSILTPHGDKQIPEMQLHGVNRKSGVHYLQQEYGWSESQAQSIYAIRSGHPHVMHRCSVDIQNKMHLGLDFHAALNQVSPNAFNTYSHVYDALSNAERALVEIAAIHPAGVPIKALAWLEKAGEISPNSLDTVVRLHHKGAISKSGNSSVQLLPLDQGYVYKAIVNKKRLNERLLGFYRSQIDDLSTEAAFAKKEEDCERLFYHGVNAGLAEFACHALFAYGWREHLEAGGRHDTLADLCNRLRSCEGFSDIGCETRGDVLYCEGVSLRELGVLAEANASLNEAERLFGAAHLAVKQANATAELGLVARKKGERGREEQAYYEIALDLLLVAPTVEAKRVRCKILARQAKALERDEGRNPDTILAKLSESLQLARELGDERWIAHRLGQLAAAYRDIMRDHKSAATYLQEALTIANRLGDNTSITAALAGMGATYEKDKQLKLAERYYGEALKRTLATDVYGMLDRLGRCAHVAGSLKHYGESEQYYDRAISLARQVENKKAEAENLDGLGAVLRTRAYDLKNNEKSVLLNRAYECHATAVALQEQLQGEPIGRINRYQELGRTLLALEKFIEARTLFARALYVLNTLPSDARTRHLEAWQYMRLGETFERLKQLPEAALCYSKAAACFGVRDKQEQAKAARRQERVLEDLENSGHSLASRLKHLDEEIKQMLEDLHEGLM